VQNAIRKLSEDLQCINVLHDKKLDERGKENPRNRDLFTTNVVDETHERGKENPRNRDLFTTNVVDETHERGRKFFGPYERNEHNEHNEHNKLPESEPSRTAMTTDALSTVNNEPKRKAIKSTPHTDGSEVWFSYASAYEARYKKSPVRNAKTNSICAMLIKNVGKEKAISLVKHYLQSSDAFYVRNYHKLDFCLSDYQKILTSLETGLVITSKSAMRNELAEHNMRIAEKFMEK
jgi:hypothetical protein